MTKSIKTNTIFSYLNTFINLLFPIITFPYVSRVLSPSGLGAYNFLLSLATYFSMFAVLGIPLYAVKQLSKVRDDQKLFNEQCHEIVTLNMVTSVITSFAYIIFGFINKVSQENQLTYWVFGLNILFSFLSVEWYFQTIESFKFIAIRNLVVKTVSIIAIFVFIKNPADIGIYAIITVGSIVCYSAINFIVFIKKERFRLRFKHIMFHLKPTLIVFAMNAAINIYVNLDTVMLGYMTNNYCVGQYTAATKLVKLITSVITSISSVLLPRLSNMFAKNDDVALTALQTKSFNFLFYVSLPCAVALIFVAKECIYVFSGFEYADAIFTTQMISPIIFFVSMSNLIGIQIFFAQDKIYLTLITVVIGAVINLILNFILIPRFYHNGAALSSVIAEFMVLVSQIILGHKYIKIKIFNKDTFKTLLALMLMAGVLLTLNIFLNGNMWMILIKVAAGVLSYLVLSLLLKHSITKEVVGYFRNLFKRNKAQE